MVLARELLSIVLCPGGCWSQVVFHDSPSWDRCSSASLFYLGWLPLRTVFFFSLFTLTLNKWIPLFWEWVTLGSHAYVSLNSFHEIIYVIFWCAVLNKEPMIKITVGQNYFSCYHVSLEGGSVPMTTDYRTTGIDTILCSFCYPRWLRGQARIRWDVFSGLALSQRIPLIF